MRVAVAAVLALSCTLAHADPPGMTPIAPPGLTPVVAAPAPANPKPLASYRGQTLTADGIALGLLLVAVNADDNDRAEGFAKLSIATYALGAPLVHLTKNRGGRAVLSVTMRIALPIVGGMIGDSLRPQYKCIDWCEDSGPSDEMVLGVIAGLVAASVIDTAYLAKGDAPKVEPAPTWQPTARATQNGFALGLRGSF